MSRKKRHIPDNISLFEFAIAYAEAMEFDPEELFDLKAICYDDVMRVAQDFYKIN